MLICFVLCSAMMVGCFASATSGTYLNESDEDVLMGSPVAPASADELKVQAFLLQKNARNITNAQKAGADPYDTSTWNDIGFIFNVQRQLTQVGHSTWNNPNTWSSRNYHGSLDLSGCTALTEIRVNRSSYPGDPMDRLSSLNVVGATSLTILNAWGNNLSGTLDLSTNAYLTLLDLSGSNMSTLDVSTQTALTTLSLSSNNLTTIDISNNTALTRLDLDRNNFTTVDISNNAALTTLNLSSNNFTTVDISNNTALTTLNLSYNNLTTIDVSNNTALTTLNLSSNNLTTIDVSNNAALTSLYLSNNNLTTIDVSNNTALRYFSIGSSNLTTLDVTANPALEWLYIHNSKLTSLDVSANPELTYLYVHNNDFTSLDVSTNRALRTLFVYGNKLTKLDIANNTQIDYLAVFGNDGELENLDELLGFLHDPAHSLRDFIYSVDNSDNTFFSRAFEHDSSFNVITVEMQISIDSNREYWFYYYLYDMDATTQTIEFSIVIESNCLIKGGWDTHPIESFGNVTGLTNVTFTVVDYGNNWIENVFTANYTDNEFGFKAVVPNTAPPCPSCNLDPCTCSPISVCNVCEKAHCECSQLCTTCDTNPCVCPPPKQIIISAGAHAYLSVPAQSSSGSTLRYQWYTNTTASMTGGTAIPRATGNVYFTQQKPAGTYYYYLEITYGTVPSSIHRKVLFVVEVV